MVVGGRELSEAGFTGFVGFSGLWNCRKQDSLLPLVISDLCGQEDSHNQVNCFKVPRTHVIPVFSGFKV